MTNPHHSNPDTFDAVVIGAGPAGTTAATRLTQAGRSVLLLERRSLPRFHIGESMLPSMNVVCEKLGVLDRIKAQGYVLKSGAEFSGTVAESGAEFSDSFGAYGRIPFSAQGPGRQHTTFQVERAHFDKLLADFARECGATLIENATVQELIQEGERVTGVRYTHAGRSHTVHAKCVIDAGGRASKIVQTFGLRKYNDRRRMVAVFRHFKGLDEKYNPGHEGDIQVHGHNDGWVWAIPIWPDTISIGTVTPRSVFRDSDPEQLFKDHVARAKRISMRLTGTEPVSELRIETDYCYYSDTVAGPGWFMAGDAGCFVDPIFSAGVLLAMTTGFTAAETLDKMLSEPDRAEELQHWYSNFYKTGYDMNNRIICAYYESGYNLHPFLASVGMDASSARLANNQWLVRLLAGDFWSGHNALNALLRKQSRWDTFAPFEPALGCPFYAELNDAEQALTRS